jgi:uncharacterized protein (TIGR04141 family)
MARSKNTKTHSVYLIDRCKLLGDSATNENEAIKLLMSADLSYKQQTLKTGIDTQGFSICLYFRGDDNYQSKFASFCKEFVEENQDAVTFHPRTTSSVLFVWNEKHIYAITTGQGFRMIEAFSFPKFGLIVASIFEEKFKITSLDSNAMSSMVHSTKTVYSNEVDFIDVSSLDTVFKEVTGRLKDASKVRSLLNLEESSKKKSMKVIAKNFVQFSSALDFAGLLHLLQVIDGYNFEGYSDRFNLITPLNTKKDKNAIQQNDFAVIDKLYSAIQANEEISFDMFHEDTMSFVSAETYELYDSNTGAEYISFGDCADLEVLTKAYNIFLHGSQDSSEAFRSFVLNTRIRSMTDDLVVTDAPLLKHVSGEIEVEDKNYYIFYGRYYFLNASYTDRLNDSLQGKLRSGYQISVLRTTWNGNKDENWFNQEVSQNEGYIHLHKALVDYIEFADLMKVEDGQLTIVHVKDGFDCNMRALDRQVELSIAKLMDIKHYNNELYFRQLYNTAAKSQIGKNITTVFPSVDLFLECMKHYTPRYIIAIRPARKDLLDNTSNIAKHCLNAMILRCFQQGIDLKIQVL